MPRRVVSLFLCPPGGSLLTTRTDDLLAFGEEKNAGLDVADLTAVEANVRAWVVGPGRIEADVEPGVLAAVRQMQRRVFDIDEAWDEVEWVEMAPPALERLDQIEAPTHILLGRYDLETTKNATERLCAGIRHAKRTDWPDSAHCRVWNIPTGSPNCSAAGSPTETHRNRSARPFPKHGPLAARVLSAW